MKKALIALMLVSGMAVQSVSAAGLGACTHMGLGNGYDNSLNVNSAKELKLGWIRDECRWDYVQNGKDGAFSIRSKDLDYIKNVDAAGINQLLLLGYGNSSYEGEADFPKTSNPDYYNGYLDYVRYTVETVAEYVDAYEIWNEPNIEGFNPNGNAEDYAQLFLDASAIVKELDPTARILCGCITGAGDGPFDWGNRIFEYIKARGDVNELIDIFSIHLYSSTSDDNYAKSLDKWEELFDSYGFTGDVWMTENGVSAGEGVGESKQAAYLPKIAMRWENWLRANDRNGENFWYDLRNDVGISDYEDNFGLVNAAHHIKPAGKAMTFYNKLLGNAKINGVAQIKTKDNFFTSDQYGYLGTYTDYGRTIYLAYDTNGNKKSTNVSLSGDVAYVYDNLGNLIETITSPNGSKSVTLAYEPTYVEDITYKTSINDVSYDDVQGVISVSGKASVNGTVTIELIKDGNVVRSQKATVMDSAYTGWISVHDGGEYTVRVGYPELTALGKTEGYSEEAVSIEGAGAGEISATVVYSSQNRKVSINATIGDMADEQYVTVLVIPESMDIANIDMNAVGYIRQIPVKDGVLSQEFILPEYFTTNAKVYLGGTGIGKNFEGEAEIAESDYLYVAGFDIAKGDTLTASAICRNFNQVDQTATISIAQYGEGGKLENVVTEKRTVPKQSYAPIECRLEGVEIADGATFAKAFIWDAEGGMKPLAVFDSTELK